MKVTVVMANDFPEKVLQGTVEDNKELLDRLHHEINTKIAWQTGVKYDPKDKYSARVFVRGYDFEIKDVEET